MIETGEYYEELKETGVPRRPREYFWGLRSPEVLRLLPQDSQLDRGAEQRPTWDRDDYGVHLASSLREGTTPNGVFAARFLAMGCPCEILVAALESEFDTMLETDDILEMFGGTRSRHSPAS